MVMQRLTLILVLILSTAIAQAASLQATVDRNPVTENDSVRLTLTAKDVDGDLNPDLTALKELFDVISTAQSNQMSYINGRMSSSKQLHIILAPKQTGSLVIPSLAIGQLQSKPIVLHVVAAGSQAQSGGVADVKLEAMVDNQSPYLQQQVILTVRLTHAIELAEGILPNPEIPGVEVYKLGEDKGFRSVENGRAISIIERRYALLPQQSGEITIPSQLFRGQTQGRSNFGGIFNAPFNQGRQLQARSKPITLQVKPKPQSGGGAWLPAKSLTLSETWSSEPEQFRVGEPITRTLTLRAEGLSANQLPELKLSTPNGVKIYPDQPQLESSANEQGIIGIRIEKLAMVATQAGTLTLPAITLTWWNSEKQQLELAKLPARTIQVAPANLENSPVPAINQQTMPISSPLPDEITNNAALWPWQLATSLFALLWLFTLWLYWNKKTRPTQPSASFGSAHKVSLKAVRKACSSNTPQAARDALLQWSKSCHPQQPARSLVELAKQLDQQQAQQALQQLDAVIYKGEQQWDGVACWETIEAALKEIGNHSTKAKKPQLAELYQ